ncbi:aminopeptidase N [Oligoflexus tunisiensis]|uniref:aminopeptidase N n=1 Tax=Oligoflexus tunisiensis TaxID=708132 RepID=UPI000B0E5345|nr:aminopeptidase N [Oligoflexus tunisiensis]
MKAEAPQAVLLKDYRPPSYWVKSVKLTIDLDPDKTVVRSAIRYQHNPGQPHSLRLEGSELTLVETFLDKKPLDVKTLDSSPQHLEFSSLPDEFELELVTHINPRENLAYEGLYLSRNNYYTQCEPEGFRRITYFLDRPDVMTEYVTTIRGSKEHCPVLLSNGNLIDQGPLPDGRHYAVWHDPFPKPSYLFALVAGKLSRASADFTTQSGRKVDIHLYVEEVNLPKTPFALDAIKRAMAWDEKVYGLEYDLDLFMVVAVSDFNMGAMENKGLNIFNSKYILASTETATDEDFEKILGVVGHEYFHNWTGNRVTLRDWFQLSLKEGLTVFRDQEFSSDEGSRAVKRVTDVRLLREQQFPEDGGPMAHPVRPESYIEINNFYTPTVYHKGAEVIRMLHTIIGADVYRRTMDRYFAKFDGQAVTVEDFLAVVEEVSGQSMSQFKLWYQQAGTPQVDVQRRYDAASRSLTLTVQQTLPTTPEQSSKKPQLIPLRLAFLGASGKALETTYLGRKAHEHLVLLDQMRQEFVFQDVSEQPIPSLLRGFSAPVILDAHLDRAELHILLRADTDAFNRYEAGQTLALQTILGKAKGTIQALDAEYVAAFRALLNDSDVDPRLVAMSIQAPTTDYIINREENADMEAVFQARSWLLQQLAEQCAVELLACYNRTREISYKTGKEAIGRRDLNNACLQLMAAYPTETTLKLIHEHYRTATNMTDSFGALSALVHLKTPLREATLQDFYSRWKGDALVIDKWFQVQSSSQHPDVLQHVKDLLAHPDFDIHNPNRIYSVFRHFTKGNPYGFHHRSGAGYALVADYILRIDATNPQVAAVLATVLSRFRKFDSSRQGQIRQHLERIAAKDGLSRDVFEIVSKSLA